MISFSRVCVCQFTLADAELAQMIELADSDRDGTVTAADFEAIMMRKTVT